MTSLDQLLEPALLDRDAVILLSGGIDSAALAALVAQQKLNASTLFIDYGQGPRAAERKSSMTVAETYGLPWQEIQFNGLHFGAGELRGRNAFLVHLGLLALETPTCVLYLGVHAGTGYRDCTPEFLELMQRSLDFHTGGQVRLTAPFVDASKAEVYALAADFGVPFEITYSCEAGSEPCGDCMSCRDRAMLNART